MGKNFPCIPQGMKKAYPIHVNRIFKIFQHYAPLCVFFFRIMQIMRSELNYAILHQRITLEALQ